MAGIGFVLRKLASQDNFSGIIRAYFHSSIIACGPWILVVVCLGIIIAFTTELLGLVILNQFLSVLIYNFSFSLILTSPLYMISARYVSDSLYLKDLAPIPGIMITSFIYMLIPALPISFCFYFFYATMSPFGSILSVINFVLLCEIWLAMLYLGMLWDFKAITLSWFTGTILTVFLSIYLASYLSWEGILLGFNLGLVFLVYSLIAHVLAEYPYPFRKAKEFKFYYHYYRGLFWSGFFLFSSLWIDKVILWFAPESTLHFNNLRTYPVYDGGMFFSYLSIIPVMALFIFSLETNFYDSYIAFIQHIEQNAPLSFIEEEKEKIFHQVMENGRSYLVLQGILSLILILTAPVLYEAVNGDFLQLGIFRLGTLGAFFAALNFFIVIVFSYFDNQENMVKVSLTMLISNTSLSIASLYLGFPYYGFGYCLSMIISFLLAAILLIKFLDNLTYHIFITNVVKREKVREHYQTRFHEE